MRAVIRKKPFFFFGLMASLGLQSPTGGERSWIINKSERVALVSLFLWSLLTNLVKEKHLSHSKFITLFCSQNSLVRAGIYSSWKSINFAHWMCSSLQVCFFQACRGRRFDFGVEIPSEEDAVDAHMDQQKVLRIPTEADFLMAYSVVPGQFHLN